jgi:hypothetical protein
MRRLSDKALAAATLFKDGPGFHLTFHTKTRIHPDMKAALDELVDAKVVLIKDIDDGRGLDYQGTRRSTTVGLVLKPARLAKIKLPVTVD